MWATMKPILDLLGSLTLITLVLRGATGMERSRFVSLLLQHKMFWSFERNGEKDRAWEFRGFGRRRKWSHRCIAWEGLVVCWACLLGMFVGQMGGTCLALGDSSL
ncbi:hypothetical protein C367_02028 [Cryptococcus neoformans Ze90-1]|nr:hypothetical protein C367_02028 [Cryptococcus neoformans var. grubii Ze90-1]